MQKPRVKRPGARRGASDRKPKPNTVDLGSDKLYFKIGEVAEIVGVPAYVLRYWESEFSVIRPQKSRSQHRVYRRRDVETLLVIKHLLYDKKFTIAGARKQLREAPGECEMAPPSGGYLARQSFERVRTLMSEVQALLEEEPPQAADPAGFLRQHSKIFDSEAPAQPLLARPERSID